MIFIFVVTEVTEVTEVMSGTKVIMVRIRNPQKIFIPS